jgi:hypothetical protein
MCSRTAAGTELVRSWNACQPTTGHGKNAVYTAFGSLHTTLTPRSSTDNLVLAMVICCGGSGSGSGSGSGGLEAVAAVAAVAVAVAVAVTSMAVAPMSPSGTRTQSSFASMFQ